MAQETISGSKFDILKEGKCEHGGVWCILDARVRLIATLPKHVGEEEIREAFSGYDESEYSYYYIRLSKRWCVAVNSVDVERLELSLETI
tara:strand:+ start:2805 stop:3074 length:270 start_codon:yes stop_codon:yes gene_type:complete